jgi:hypothetical protein
MRNKNEFTSLLLNQLPQDERINSELARITWWKNIRNESGLRLTPEGRRIMKLLDIESYIFKITADRINQRILLLLDQRLQDPYFIFTDKRFPSIEFYGSKEALLVNLYGDLEKFLESYNG